MAVFDHTLFSVRALDVFDNGRMLLPNDDVTPEQYLESLAAFLGYKLTPPSKFNSNPTQDELIAVIMAHADADGKLHHNWVQAIKAVREYTGWGLKQAKDAVDPLRYHPTGCACNTCQPWY